jgi:hypothetical protein
MLPTSTFSQSSSQSNSTKGFLEGNRIFSSPEDVTSKRSRYGCSDASYSLPVNGQYLVEVKLGCTSSFTRSTVSSRSEVRILHGMRFSIKATNRECAALEGPTVYYPMLSLLTSHLPLYEGATPKKQLETIYDLIQSSSIAADHPKWDFTSFKTSLAMHESTPKIQAFYQYYDTVTNETDIGNGIGNLCDSWVEWRGKGFCDVEELKRDMELTLTDNTT